MRRRELLINETKNGLTLEYNQKTVSGTSGSFTVNIYYGGELLKDDGVTVSKSETWISSASYNKSNGYISISYKENTDIVNSRSGIVTITYQGETVELELTQNEGSLKLTLNDVNNYGATDLAAFVNPNENAKYVSVSYGTASDYNWTFGSNITWLTFSTQSGSSQYIKATEDFYGDSFRQVSVWARHKTLNKSAYVYIIQYSADSSRYNNILCSDKKEYKMTEIPSGVIPIGIKCSGDYYYSLNTMSYYTPDTGNTSKLSSNPPCYGGYDYTIGGMTTSDTPEQLSAKILAVDNSNSTAWKTASKINNTTNSQYTHPAAQCCWRYHTTGTNQGDWCLPTTDMAKIICGDYSSRLNYGNSLRLASLHNKWGVNATRYSYPVLGGRESNATTCCGGNWTGSSAQTTCSLSKKSVYDVRAVIYAPQST